MKKHICIIRSAAHSLTEFAPDACQCTTYDFTSALEAWNLATLTFPKYL